MLAKQVVGVGVVVSLFIVRAALGAAANAAAKPQATGVIASDERLKIVATRYSEEASFSTYGRFPAQEFVKLKESDETFLAVDLETEFPEAPGWDLGRFFLREKAAKVSDAKPHPVIGFTVPNEEGRYYPAERGAAGIIVKKKEGGVHVVIAENPLGRPQQIFFGYIRAKDGTPEKWPGGKATVRLLFRVPKQTASWELVMPPVTPQQQEAPKPEFRTWTDITGKFKTEAAFVHLKDGKVQLKKKDGTVITVPIEKLSETDQESLNPNLVPKPGTAIASAAKLPPTKSEDKLQEPEIKTTTKNAHVFPSATLDVEVQGFRWIDAMILHRGSGVSVEAQTRTVMAPSGYHQRLSAKKGFRLIGFPCSFSLKGDQTEVKSPQQELKLSLKNIPVTSVGVFIGTTHRTPITNLTKLGCAILDPEIVFAVPADALERDLTLTGAAGNEKAALSVDTLPELKE